MVPSLTKVKDRAVLATVKGAEAPLRGGLRPPLTVTARRAIRNLARTEKRRFPTEQKNGSLSEIRLVDLIRGFHVLVMRQR